MNFKKKHAVFNKKNIDTMKLFKCISWDTSYKTRITVVLFGNNIIVVYCVLIYLYIYNI